MSDRLPHFFSRWLTAGLSVALALVCASAALADWRKDIGTFRIGMLAAAAPSTDGLQALRRAYSAALGMPVDFFLARDYAMLIDAQASARLEYAIYSATGYATVSELCACVEPVAAPLDVDGAAGIMSVLFVRTGKASSLEDVVKLKTVVSPADDVSSWLAPLALLPGEGIDLAKNESALINAAKAANAAQLFADGKADAIFGWERASAEGDVLPGGTLAALAQRGVPQADVTALWKSPLIRFGPHAVLKSLDSEAKHILSSFLTGLHGDNAQAYDLLSGGHGGGFAEVADQDYDIARQIVRAIAVHGER